MAGNEDQEALVLEFCAITGATPQQVCVGDYCYLHDLRSLCDTC